MYFLIVRGSATLVLPTGRHRLGSGSFFISHPELHLGWTARRDEEQDVLCWIWKSPPKFPEIRPADGDWLRFQISRDAAVVLQTLHRATRTEIARSDRFTPLAVRQKQTEIDILLAREAVTPSEASGHPPMLRQALDWIAAHPAAQRPVADLCDRLNISPSRLARLFREHLNTTPSAATNAAKIDFAQNALSTGASVKSVALDLGYRHAHDFSRFFRQQTGLNPAACQPDSKPQVS